MDFFTPRISSDTAAYWQGCREHELRVSRCKCCGEYVWPAGRFCPNCLSEETELVTLPREGTLYSFVVMHKPFHPSLADKVPYIVATVDVAENVRILANIFNQNPDTLHCGDRVRIDFLDSETYSRPIAVLEEKR